MNDIFIPSILHVLGMYRKMQGTRSWVVNHGDWLLNVRPGPEVSLHVQHRSCSALSSRPLSARRLPHPGLLFTFIYLGKDDMMGNHYGLKELQRNGQLKDASWSCPLFGTCDKTK